MQQICYSANLYADVFKQYLLKGICRRLMCRYLTTFDAILPFNHGITKTNFQYMCFKLSIKFAHEFALYIANLLPPSMQCKSDFSSCVHYLDNRCTTKHVLHTNMQTIQKNYVLDR